MELAGVRMTQSRRDFFNGVLALANVRSADHEITKAPIPRTSIPYLNEPWYC
jgi:hypothetical protein